MNQIVTRSATWLAPWIAAVVFSAGLVLAISTTVIAPAQAETTVQCISQDDPMLTYAVTTHRVPERLGSTCFGNGVLLKACTAKFRSNTFHCSVASSKK